ncbi:MAG: M48 family metallopeptidase [Arenimonas sp.]
MNFFQRQDEHRRQSRRLVFLFSLAVFAVVAAVDLVLMVAFGGLTEDGGGNVAGALFASTFVTLAVIGAATMYRVASLRGGGATVARQLGATPVPESTTDFHLRRLRNVVEEIAIASGVPVPQVFILEEEEAINAFAAGYAPADAAVTVTRGALDKLNRDELQGMIAHEFSHVLNGDMRLNIRLIGLLFGIMVLALIGRKILEHGRFRGKDGAPILLMALGLLVVGYIGLFFGRLIKAGVSRQREYLADASAVQFTRQVDGLAGTLKKIGGLPAGSKLANSDAEEISHLVFADGVGYSSLMATHPPLLERIRALDPSFTGQKLGALAARWQSAPPVGVDEDVTMGLDGVGAARLPKAHAQFEITPPAVVAQVGAPQADDFRRAGSLAEGIPEELQSAARDHEQVVPLLFGLVIGADPDARRKQELELKARQGAIVAVATFGFADQLATMHPMLRLPLAALAFPVLRRRPRAELGRFVDALYALAHADGRVDLFEYCLGRLLHVQVQEALDPAKGAMNGSRRLSEEAVRVAAIDLLAVLANAGHDDADGAQRAYLAGLSRVYPRVNAPYHPPKDANAALDLAWPVLDALQPLGKELLIEGLVAAVSSDTRVSVAEAELLRVVCASLHCPLPPMLEAPTSRMS